MNSTIRSSEVLIGGTWRSSQGNETFAKLSPLDGSVLGRYPVSPWEELSLALDFGVAAFREIARLEVERLALYLECYADRIDSVAGLLVEVAHRETALPMVPRLRDVELPRTTDQLRQAAHAVRTRSWVLPVISTSERIASYLAPLPGVVAVFGPNNFPFAFNSAAGGDFAAAIATGHPVIAKANPGHPQTTQILAEEARAAAAESGVPPSIVQMVHRTSHETGKRLVADHRLAASAYTGSRTGGISLKAAADLAGKPIYLEMSSVNPIVVLPGALRERTDAIAEEWCASMVLGVGQFCTSPGLVFVPAGSVGDRFVDEVARRVSDSPAGTLLDDSVREGLVEVRSLWEGAGAREIAVGDVGIAFCTYPTTVMQVSAAEFIVSSQPLQTEAFGNMALLVRYDGTEELSRCIEEIDGNLTGSIYSSTTGHDDAAYEAIVAGIRERVGRLLNDKMPTGVAVVSAMHHGGPFPSTGHPGFTAVGIPASLRRFGAIQCFDNVRDHRLPPELRADNPLGLQRFVDGTWTTQPTS